MLRHSLFGLLVLSIGASSGCTGIGEGDAGSDASADSGGDGSAGALVTPPDIPWLAEGMPPVMLTPCLEGWREVRHGDITECDPYPEGGPEVCEVGDAHFPGERGCRPVGDTCPAGDYGTAVPSSGAVVYVNSSAPTGGDGSLLAPFATLAEVPWVSLSEGTTVALGKGSYPGVLPLKAGVSVVGACARETVLTGLDAPVPSVVSVTSAGEPAEVANLSVRGAPQFGAFVRGGRRLRLHGVIIERTLTIGVAGVEPGTEISLSDVVIRDTEASTSSREDAGTGILLQAGARLDGTSLIVANHRFGHIAAMDPGTAATLTATVLRDTRPRDTETVFGHAVIAQDGGRIEATGLLVSANQQSGVFANGVGSAVTLTDSIIRGIEARERGNGPNRGVQALRGAQVSATRLLVADSREFGILITDDGSRGTLTDVVVRDTVPTGSGEAVGHGLNVELGAECAATRLLLSDSTELGVLVRDPGTTLTVIDTVVRHTAPSVDGRLGMGISVHAGAHFEATRLLVTENRTMGILATDEGTAVTLSDTILREMLSQASDGRFGRGIQAQRGAALHGARLEVDGALEAGVVAVTGANVALEDATIRRVQRADCASTSCTREEYGYGVGAFSSALTLTRFRVVDAAVCGVIVAQEEASGESSLDLEAGLVSESAIGACVQIDGYDFSRLTNDVRYQDNGTNLDTTMLPVPGTIGSL